MTPFTLGLIGFAALLVLANVLVSLLPKKGKVNVSFIPPSSNTPSAGAPDMNVKLDAHIQSTNHKIAGLFSRVEVLEKNVQTLLGKDAPVRDQTWIQTVPVRAGKHKKK